LRLSLAVGSEASKAPKSKNVESVERDGNGEGVYPPLHPTRHLREHRKTIFGTF